MRNIIDLSELTAKIAKANVQVADAMVAKYIEEAVRHITERGDKIEDYTLYFVNNPMETVKDGLKVSVQYRIGHIDELRNLPVYGERNNE